MRNGFANFLRRFARDRAAASAAEFALVLPLLILFLFGIIDVGRLMWEWNRAEKATQMGVRYAAVTDIVPSDLVSYDFTTVSGVLQGAPINSTLFPGVSCTNAAACTCKGSCGFSLTASSTAFNNIVARMNLVNPRITAPNVVVDYDPSGLGFAGNPYGPDVAPIITVRLRNLQFQPTLGQIFGGSINMAGFASSMTMEDGAGAASN
jgi:Flp pilus assembly pilin Flp